MRPETGKQYRVRHAQFGDMIATCDGPACAFPWVIKAHKGADPDGRYQFSVALPHEGDAGRGVGFIAHESEVVEEAG